MRVPFRVLFIRVPYYIGDLKRDPNLENYPSMRVHVKNRNKGPGFLNQVPTVSLKKSLGAGF